MHYYNQAEVTAKKDNRQNTPVIGDIYTHLGALYGELGQYREALVYHEKAREAYHKASYPKGTAAAYHNKGYILAESKSYSDAVAAFTQALRLRRELADPLGEAETLNSLGFTLADQGKQQEALTMLLQAEEIVINLDTPNPRVLAATLDSIGTVYKKMKEYPKALQYYGRSLEIWLEIAGLDGERVALGNIGDTLQLMGKEEQAITLYKMAVNVSQQIRHDVTTLPREVQLSYTTRVEESYRKLADLLISAGRLAEAEYVLSLLKDEEFRSFMRPRSGPADNNEISYSSGTEQEVAASYASAKTTNDRQERNKAINQFLAELSKEFAAQDRSEEFGAKETKYLQRVQGQLKELGEGIVLLHTFKTSHQLRLLVTTTDAQYQRDSNIEWPELSKLVSDFRIAIKQKKADVLPLAQQLYHHIIAPVEDILNAEKTTTLLISLDDVLRYLPVSALHDGRQFLCQRFQINLYLAGARDHLTTKPVQLWRVAGLGISETPDTSFAALPAVSNELNAIVLEEDKPDDGVYPGVVRLNDAFTAHQLWEDLEAKYPVVHIASHFELNPASRDDSFLLLGSGQRLSLEDFKNEGFPLYNVDLLTLSACDTATGAQRGDGREVESLAVLALELGAKAVMATLWQVDDASTADFMVNFYAFRREGLSKAAAYQKVQRFFIESKNQAEARAVTSAPGRGPKPLPRDPATQQPGVTYGHPYYWAPFILMGNFL